MKKDRRVLYLTPFIIIIVFVAVFFWGGHSSDKYISKKEADRSLSKKRTSFTKNDAKDSEYKINKRDFYKLNNKILSQELLPINDDIKRIKNDLKNLKPCQIFEKYKSTNDEINEWRTLGNYYQGSKKAELLNPRRIIYEKNLGADLYDSFLNDINDFQTVELISIDFPLIDSKFFINDTHNIEEIDMIYDLIKNRNTALKSNVFDKLNDSFDEIDLNFYNFLVMMNNISKIKRYVDQQSLYEKVELYFENNSSNNQLRHAFESKKLDYLRMAKSPGEIALALNLYQKSKNVNYQDFLKIARHLKDKNSKAYKNFKLFIENEVTYFLSSSNYNDMPLEYFNVLKIFDQRIKDMTFDEFKENKNMFIDPIYGKGCDDRGLKDLCDKYCSRST